jgi:hypothetical protein
MRTVAVNEALNALALILKTQVKTIYWLKVKTTRNRDYN